MINHMRDKHALIWTCAIVAEKRLTGGSQAGEKGLSDKAVTPSQKNEMLFNIDKLYHCLTRWIVTAHNSFTVVKNNKFIEFVTYLKPALEGHLVQSQAIQDCIFSHAGTMQQQMGQYMHDLPALMAIACNAWTSANQIAFLVITRSWITSDWRSEETLLDFVKLQGAHNSQNMATAVATALTELGIQDKLVALVSDNASSNGMLVQHLLATMERSSSASCWDCDKGHIQCLSHVIHLAVMLLLHGVFAIPPSTDIQDFDPTNQTLSINKVKNILASHNDKARESDDSTEVDPAVNLALAIDKIHKIARIVQSSPQCMELF
ncbi:unnamed protein product [Rhizoctonia solani]|uniref:AC transposase n=1 Tax=Rhizoctonia solani TaxID=456999 RepID=A0A8H3GDD5_9AGAM|nr:unnamed protein product [Rhizoctonia solani]